MSTWGSVWSELFFSVLFLFFFNDTATTEIYTLSLHDALPISLDHCFPNIMKYGNPGQSSAGMTIRHPITVLHLVSLCADNGPIAIVTGAPVLARFGIYSDASRPVDVRCRSVRRRKSCRHRTPRHSKHSSAGNLRSPARREMSNTATHRLASARPKCRSYPGHLGAGSGQRHQSPDGDLRNVGNDRTVLKLEVVAHGNIMRDADDPARARNARLSELYPGPEGYFPRQRHRAGPLECPRANSVVVLQDKRQYSGFHCHHRFPSMTFRSNAGMLSALPLPPSHRRSAPPRGK